MDMSKIRRFKFATTLVTMVLILGIIGVSVVVANGYGGYEETDSLQSLQSASGLLSDWVQTDQTATGGEIKDYTVVGEWTLNCHKECIKARLNQIDFDMAFAMYRDSVKSEANSSHGHQFWGFSATKVTLDGEILTIDGQITGSNEIGTDEIQIKLRKEATGNFTFFFKMDDGTLSLPASTIVTEVGGVVIKSNGGRDDD